VLQDPNQTPYDLHFQVLGVPVRIHPGFWIAGFVLGFSDGDSDPAAVLIFIGVLFVSILIHEMGHALVMRRFGYSPRVVLYHFGGLAIPEDDYSTVGRRPKRDTWSAVLISLAGPGAGFVFAALVVAAVFATGGGVYFDPSGLPNLPWHVEPPPRTGVAVYLLVQYLLYVNIFWGLVNLVPVLPLDGGQVARDLLMHRDRYNGLTQALQLSVAMGILMAVFLFLSMPGQYGTLMFALLAVSNFLTLQQLGRSW
jgi:stage IV sporulation protein FB